MGYGTTAVGIPERFTEREVVLRHGRVLTARSEPIAEASLPAMRARKRPGIAMAAMIPISIAVGNSYEEGNPK